MDVWHAGLAYNRSKTGRDLTSLRDLFDPAFKGRVTMQTEVRDTLGLVMLSRAWRRNGPPTPTWPPPAPS